MILRQLFKLEVEQVLDTNLFCKVITLLVCNVIANECNRHWSWGNMSVTRVKACNCTGELQAFMDEVRMGTFISSGGHVAISWPYHGQAELPECSRKNDANYVSVFCSKQHLKEQFEKCKQVLSAALQYYHEGIKFRDTLRYSEVWEGNHKESDLIQLLPACFPFHCFSCTHVLEISCFTPAQLVDGEFGCVPGEELAHQEATPQPVCRQIQDPLSRL